MASKIISIIFQSYIFLHVHVQINNLQIIYFFLCDAAESPKLDPVAATTTKCFSSFAFSLVSFAFGERKIERKRERKKERKRERERERERER